MASTGFDTDTPGGRPERRRGAAGHLRRPSVVVLAALALTALLTAGCTDDDGSGGGATLDDVVRPDDDLVDEDVDRIDGQDVELGDVVTVSGEVSEQLTLDVFEIGGEQPASPGILVISDPGHDHDDLEEGETSVRVTGRVILVDEDVFEEQLGIEMDESIAELDAERAIHADSIEVLVDELPEPGDVSPVE